jgi:hypothetical protein
VSLSATPAFVGADENGGGVYNEVAFRYFLARERRRAARANRPLVLLLVIAQSPRARNSGLLGYTNEIFAVLQASVREVDFVGWYRDNVAAAALLSVGGAGSDNGGQTLRARFDRRLRQRLSAEEAALFRVRVVELGRTQRT